MSRPPRVPIRSANANTALAALVNGRSVGKDPIPVSPAVNSADDVVSGLGLSPDVTKALRERVVGWMGSTTPFEAHKAMVHDLRGVFPEDHHRRREVMRRATLLLSKTRAYRHPELGKAMSTGGPFIGPRGGKWADAAHTIPWDDPGAKAERKKKFQDMLADKQKKIDETKKMLHLGGEYSIGDDLYLVILPEANHPGKFRTTRYNSDGFLGHETYDTLEKLKDDVAKWESGKIKPATGSLDRLSRTDKWSEGSARGAVIMALNSLGYHRRQDDVELINRHVDKHGFRSAADALATWHENMKELPAKARKDLAKAALAWDLIKARNPLAAGQLGLFDAPAKPPSGGKRPPKAPPKTSKTGGPFIGPRGGKWADAQHTIPWQESKPKAPGPEKLSWKKTQLGYEARDGKIKIRKKGASKWEVVYHGDAYPLTGDKPSFDHAEGLIKELDARGPLVNELVRLGTLDGLLVGANVAPLAYPDPVHDPERSKLYDVLEKRGLVKIIAAHRIQDRSYVMLTDDGRNLVHDRANALLIQPTNPYRSLSDWRRMHSRLHAFHADQHRDWSGPRDADKGRSTEVRIAKQFARWVHAKADDAHMRAGSDYHLPAGNEENAYTAAHAATHEALAATLRTHAADKAVEVAEKKTPEAKTALAAAHEALRNRDPDAAADAIVGIEALNLYGGGNIPTIYGDLYAKRDGPIKVSTTKDIIEKLRNDHGFQIYWHRWLDAAKPYAVDQARRENERTKAQQARSKAMWEGAAEHEWPSVTMAKTTDAERLRKVTAQQHKRDLEDYIDSRLDVTTFSRTVRLDSLMQALDHAIKGEPRLPAVDLGLVKTGRADGMLDPDHFIDPEIPKPKAPGDRPGKLHRGLVPPVLIKAIPGVGGHGKAQIGEVHQWGGQSWKKVAEGKWEPVTQGKQPRGQASKPGSAAVRQSPQNAGRGQTTKPRSGLSKNPTIESSKQSQGAGSAPPKTETHAETPKSPDDLKAMIAQAIKAHGADAVKEAVLAAGGDVAQHVDQELQTKAEPFAESEPVKDAVEAWNEKQKTKKPGKTKKDAKKQAQALADHLKQDGEVVHAAQNELRGMTDGIAEVAATAAEKHSGDPTHAPSKTKAVLRAILKGAAGSFVFGFIDNFLLYVAGNAIDKGLAMALGGASAAVVAGLGNAVSDATGQAGSNAVDKLLDKVGLGEEETKTKGGKKILAEKTEKKIKSVASVAGVFAGAIAGMLPLLFGVSFGKSLNGKPILRADTCGEFGAMM